MRGRIAVLGLTLFVAAPVAAQNAVKEYERLLERYEASFKRVSGNDSILQAHRAALRDPHGDSLAVETVGEPNFALIDHWNTGAALREINRGKWDFVVLQQGPSSVDLNRDTLRMATKLFAPSIAKAGGKPVLFSAWTTSDRQADFPRAIESYRLAATDVTGLMAPVASAWLTILTNSPSVQLYDTDGLHPTVAGSYLSALVIYGRS
jgi:hypothetical protein